MNSRRAALRPLKFQTSYLPHAEGSCLVSMGNTKVLCVATVEEGAPPHAEEKGTGWIHADYAMLPRAGEKRTPRSHGSGGGRAREISRLVGRSLRAAVNLSLLPRLSIQIDCDVIRADGGTRTASVNGGFVALYIALLGLWKKGVLSQWPVKNYIGAVSIGNLKGELVLDMSYEADKEADTDLNVVMTDKLDFVELQATAEGTALSEKSFTQMTKLAKAGIKLIIEQERRALLPFIKRAKPRFNY